MSFKPAFHSYNPKLIAHAKNLRSNMTPAERKLWYDFLRTKKPRWLRQKPVADFILDFYCPALQLAVEVDGETHTTAEAEEYDAQRTKKLGALGIEVIRFTNTEVLADFDRTCEKMGLLIVKRSQ